jgi:hypothetical protein
MGTCPDTEESAGVNYSHRCPKGNRQLRRVLNQAAKPPSRQRTIFAVVYRRLVPRLGHAQAIGAITHRLCRLIWKLLHERVRFEERGPAVSAKAEKMRARKMVRELRSLGDPIAGIALHKKMLAAVIADVEVDGRLPPRAPYDRHDAGRSARSGRLARRA